MTGKNLLKHILLSALFPVMGTVSLHGETLPSDPSIRTGRLDNGLTYFLLHNAQTPGQADFYIANRVGSIVEEPDQRGLAHFLEHLAFNGTDNFPGGNGEENSIRGWCERHGIKFGADLNAYTSIDETVYNMANVPVANPGVADTCLLILKDWASGLLLKDEEIDAERGVVREEWRTRRSRFATTRMMEQAMPVIYAGSKYEDCLPIGNMEVIDTFPYARLRDFYDTWYRPDLQGVVIVGDIDVNVMETKMKELFGSIPLNESPVAREYYPVYDNEEMILYVKSDDEQPTLNFSLYMKRDAEPRDMRSSREAYVEAYKSKLAMFIIRQRLARLSHEAEPKIMSASVRDNSFYVTPEKDAFALTIGLLPDHPQAGIDAVMEVIENVRRYGFSESELEHAKIQHAVQMEHKRETGEKTRNAEHVQRILRHFLDSGPLMSLDYEADLQAELNETITLKDINEAVKSIITNRNQVAILFGPTYYDGKPYVMPSEVELKQWVTDAQVREYQPKDAIEEVSQVFITQLPNKGEIISKKDVGNGYTEYLLSNGIRVSARTSALEPNRLTLNMFRLGGESLYPDEDAATLAFLGNVVKESGASDFDYLTLEKKRRGKALRVVPYIDSEEEGVRGVCAASDLKTWLEVMYLYLTEPRRDEGIFNSIINRQRSLLKNRDANPNVAYKDSLRIAIYGDGPRHQPITLDRLDEVSLDRIYEIYGERFSDLSGMHLIVTGDIREDEFEDLLCQYVASLPGTPVAASDDTPVPGSTGPYLDDIRKGKVTKKFNKAMKTPSALTDIVYSAEIPYTAENDLALDMLCQILRGVFTEKIREDKGRTYGVNVSGQCWKLPTEGCSLTINFRCDPQMYDELMPIIGEEMEAMARKGPTATQLDKVKEYERKTYDRAVETNGWWEYVRYNQIKDGIDFNKNYIRRVDSITPQMIQNLCKKLDASGNLITVSMIAEN